MILPDDYTVPSSSMEYATKNEYKYFYNRMSVALFGLKNMEFNRKFGFIKSLLELSGRQDAPLHPNPL